MTRQTTPLLSRKPRRSELVRLTARIAEMHGVRPELIVAQVERESRFNPRARSPKGAIGIAQIMPGTAREWGVNPHNPVASLHAMSRAMRRFIRKHLREGHDRRTAEKLALADYNAGPGAVEKYGKVPPYRETRPYVKVILNKAEKK
jgi:soluble lytic murein transglycosylase-like protein